MTEVQVIKLLCDSILKKHKFNFGSETKHKYNDEYLLFLVDIILDSINQVPYDRIYTEQLVKVRESILKCADEEGYQYKEAMRYVWSKSLVDTYNYIKGVCNTTRKATVGTYEILTHLYESYDPSQEDSIYEKPEMQGPVNEMVIYMK